MTSDRRVRAVQPHVSTYPDPLRLAAGQEVALGKRDDQFPGWVWATPPAGPAGWAPEANLAIGDDGTTAVAVEDYSAFELDTEAGELLSVERELKGWLWVRNSAGASGWVPTKTTEPLAPA